MLAREYSDPVFFDIHRLSVDAYAVQHPGGTDRQSVQSVGVHLIRLCLFLEHGLTPDKANEAMLKAGQKKHAFVFLPPPEQLGTITAADVHKAKTVKAHKSLVVEWAHDAWKAWSTHHDTVRAWLPNNTV